jgi:site-specific recombinase
MSIEGIFQKIDQHQPKHPELLKQLWDEVKNSSATFDRLISRLQADEKARVTLKGYINNVFQHKDLTYAFVESGISSRTGFTAEIIRKIKHSILPEERDDEAFHQVLFDVFKQSQLSPSKLICLFETLEIELDFGNPIRKAALLDAVEILSYRITASAIESEFIRKFKRNKRLQSFILQNKEIHTLLAQHTLGIAFNPHLVNHIKKLLKESLSDIQVLKKNAHHQGISLQLTYALHRISQQIERLNLLLDFYLQPKLSSEQFAKLVFELMHNEQNKNSIRRQLNDTTYLLAYQITEHESRTGEHYIADTKADFNKMFRSSCGGGIFASLMTVCKIGLHHLAFAPFWQAFAYSINYAAGFVGIQLTHATLATKQPAMTASKIAHALDHKGNTNNADSMKQLALMIGKVSRSQWVSFAGNLLVVFPLSFGIAWLWSIATGENLVTDSEAQKMLHDVHPYLNLTWFYASITGVFLFLSGIISGYYDNKVIYSKIPTRIRSHPALQRWLPKRLLIALSKYVEHGLGSLIGNICLGFFLGTAGFIGYIFGLPFDIRHITISSGNYAIAMFTLLESVQWQYALVCLVGVLGVGVFNFIVSFGLAIFVAARSRKVKAVQFVDLMKWTGIYFRKYPKDFVWAPHQERQVDELTG